MQHEVRRAKAVQLPPGDLAANYHPLPPREMKSKLIELPEDEPVLRDPRILDFRPRQGSPLIDAGRQVAGITDGFAGEAPDIGAYEHGTTEYWIPGHQEPHATRPVPPTGASDVRADTHLMWLGGYQAASHLVDFGSDCNAVAAADADAEEYRGEFPGNLFTPPELRAGQEYFWRVDARRKDGATIQGEVWEFQVAEE
jgi:hypothetical protein